jgi:hypothetical protein
MRGRDGLIVKVSNNCYVPFLRWVNLLAVTNIITRGMPVFNAMTITTMVNTWRLETNSFHLPCGEMTLTLEDVAMVLGLPIRGQPIIDHCDSSGWRDKVADFLGREPPMKVLGVKGRETGVCVTWLHEEFHECPPDVDDATMSRYTRV